VGGHILLNDDSRKWGLTKVGWYGSMMVVGGHAWRCLRLALFILALYLPLSLSLAVPKANEYHDGTKIFPSFFRGGRAVAGFGSVHSFSVGVGRAGFAVDAMDCFCVGKCLRRMDG